MKFKNVLITGGAGFIGSNLSLKLIDSGYNVTILDNLSSQVHGDSPEITSPLYQKVKNNVNFIYGSVVNSKDWMKALSEQNAVIHLAAETGTVQSMSKIKKYVSVNINGTALLLDILTNKKHTIKKIVVASSRAVYGEGKYFCEKDGVVYPFDRREEDIRTGDYECKCPICNESIRLMPTDEESKSHPKSIYGITKLNQEQMVLMVGKKLGIPAVALRFQNVFGPGQSLSNPYTGIIPIFSSQIKNGSDLNIFEDGKESRDFVYIDDAVNATISGFENDEANNNVFNVGAEKPIEVFAIANYLKRIFNADIKIVISGNYRVGDIRHNYADITKIKSILGYRQGTEFKEGIRNFCDWVNSQKTQSLSYNTI